MSNTNAMPKGWHTVSQSLWEQDRQWDAINELLIEINQYPQQKPLPLITQLGYYFFQTNHFQAGAQIFEDQSEWYQDNAVFLDYWATFCIRSKDYQKAVDIFLQVIALQPKRVNAYDGLANAYSKLKEFDKAVASGEQSLLIKDQSLMYIPLTFPAQKPVDFVSGKKQVVSFSLFGNHPKYLRGALDNALAMTSIYPGWQARYYIDDTVPKDVIEALQTLNCEIFPQPSGQSLKQKLAWRFQVANDEDVGRFLVRDVDSRINLREKQAVDAWLQSDYWFHVMRDWWTHTDLILAGMFGGIAGVLPNMTQLLAEFNPNQMPNAHIDQHFLGAMIWPRIKQSCLMHDRCYKVLGAISWPSDLMASDRHVGENEFAARREDQEIRLQDWMFRVPSLDLNS